MTCNECNNKFSRSSDKAKLWCNAGFIKDIFDAGLCNKCLVGRYELTVKELKCKN